MFSFKIIYYVVCISLVYFSATAFAGTHASYWLKNSAESELARGNASKATSDYLNAFSIRRGRPNDYYNAACAAALAMDADLAFFWLERAVQLGYSDLKHLVGDDDLARLHDDRRWKALTASIYAKNTAFENRVNKPLQLLLEVIYDADQQARQELDEAARLWGRDSAQFEDKTAQVNAVDQKNQAWVVGVLSRFGWLGPEEIGPKASRALFLVVQHSSTGMQRKYLQMLRQAVSRGAADKEALAMLEDRVAVSEKRGQRFGTQIRVERDGSVSVPEIESPHLLDQRREDVDLPPMAVYLRNWGLSWPLPN